MTRTGLQAESGVLSFCIMHHLKHKDLSADPGSKREKMQRRELTLDWDLLNLPLGRQPATLFLMQFVRDIGNCHVF